MTAKELGEQNIVDTTIRMDLASSIMAAIAINTGRNQFSFSKPKEMAEKAAELADALLEELAKEK